MKKKAVSLILIVGMLCGILAGCGNTTKEEKVQVEVFIAASLKQSMDEIAKEYQKKHKNIQINLNADSSGTLMTQIKEGYACDIFFSAAKKQVEELEKEGLVVPNTNQELLNNQVVLIKGKGQPTGVTGLISLDEAGSIALAGATVPVGKYTRQALKNADILHTDEDADQISTKEVSDALGGVEISEQANVCKVLIAVEEGSCEVGTVYVSDLYNHEDKVDVIEEVSKELTGPVVYPVCQIINSEASKEERKEAEAFYTYLGTDKAKNIFKTYKFGVN